MCMTFLPDLPANNVADDMRTTHRRCAEDARRMNLQFLTEFPPVSGVQVVQTTLRTTSVIRTSSAHHPHVCTDDIVRTQQAIQSNEIYWYPVLSKWFFRVKEQIKLC